LAAIPVNAPRPRSCGPPLVCADHRDDVPLLAEGADWRWQRRVVAPILRHETLVSFVPIFAAMAKRQVERWRAARLCAPVDAAAAMTHTTFDIIVEAILGGSASLDADRYCRALSV